MQMAEADTEAVFEARKQAEAAEESQATKMFDDTTAAIRKGATVERMMSAFNLKQDPNAPLPFGAGAGTAQSQDVDVDYLAMLKKPVLQKPKKNTPSSSLPSGMGSGRKAILTSELNDKNEQLNELLSRFSQTNDPRVKKELNRTRGDIEALKKEMKM